MESNNIIEIEIEKLRFSFPKYNADPDRYLALHRKCDFYKEVLASIKKEGMRNPLLVIDLKNGFYEVKIGNNRLIASLELNYKKIPCIILPNSHQQTWKEYKQKYYVD